MVDTLIPIIFPSILQVINMNKQEPKRNCYWYSLGGDLKKEFPLYPEEYGARCEKLNEFFSIINDVLSPNCFECKHFKPNEE